MRLRASTAALILAARVAAGAPSPEAAQLYRDGQEAYDQARYDDALAAWRQSYALSGAAGLIYNVAQAYRLRDRPGDCATARARYQQFVALVQPSPQRALAERYITELAACATAPLAPTTPASMNAPPQAPPIDRDRSRTRELVIAGVGVAGLGLLVTGIALGHHASTLGGEITDACRVSCDWAAEKSKDADGRRDDALGWTFGTLGAVALAGAAALYYAGVREHGVGVSIDSSKAGLTWSGAW